MRNTLADLNNHLFEQLERLNDEDLDDDALEMARWKDGISVFKWWMEDENCEGQLRMDIDGRIYEEYSGEDPYFW